MDNQDIPNKKRMPLHELCIFLRRHLLDDIIPFWMNHAVDWEHGGIFTWLGDDGTIVKREKDMRYNARALWTFSSLVQRIETQEEWRSVADLLYEFLLRCGRNNNGYWNSLATEEGKAIPGEDSIIVDAFIIMAFVAYYRASKNEEVLEIADETARSCLGRLRQPFTYPTAPYPTPRGMKSHREYMQFSLAFSELGHEMCNDEYLENGLRLGREVLDYFYRPDQGVLLEYLLMDNSMADTPEGRTMVPGHAIESLWFQMHIFSHVGDLERARQAARAVQECLAAGWDSEYGGILLGIDVKGNRPPYWKYADYKMWWPCTEAMPATLLAYEHLREDWCLEWYWKIHDWAFSHFPEPTHGEWLQLLDRKGQRIQKKEFVTWPNVYQLKDPFHLPRGILESIDAIDRINKELTSYPPTPKANPPPNDSRPPKSNFLSVP